jgi:hypothetical protein
MKIILPGLTAALALAIAFDATAELPPAANATSAATSGDELMRQVLLQLERRDSITARLRFQASVDGRTLAGAGSYWQQGRGESLRIRLEMRVAGQTSLLQVSNGRFLWNDLTLPTGRSITRLDLRQLRSHATLAATGAGVDGLEPGTATWSPFQPEQSSRAGGLPALVAALSERFTFTPPQAMRWTPSPPLSGLPGSLPVYAVVGRWKRESLEALLPKPEEAGESTGKPPARVPQEVLLLVSQAESFPYHIEYRRLDDPAASQTVNGKLASFQLSGDPLVLLEYFDVAFDEPVSVGQFDYSPGDENWDDRTAEHLDKLRGKQQKQLANRKRGEQF